MKEKTISEQCLVRFPLHFNYSEAEKHGLVKVEDKSSESDDEYKHAMVRISDIGYASIGGDHIILGSTKSVMGMLVHRDLITALCSECGEMTGECRRRCEILEGGFYVSI